MFLTQIYEVRLQVQLTKIYKCIFSHFLDIVDETSNTHQIIGQKHSLADGLSGLSLVAQETFYQTNYNVIRSIRYYGYVPGFIKGKRRVLL